MPLNPEQKRIRLAGLALVLAVGAAYANSLATPFVFDDGLSIASNPTIRHLGNIRAVLSPPIVGAICARPLVNLSLGLNYAAGGLRVLGLPRGSISRSTPIGDPHAFRGRPPDARPAPGRGRAGGGLGAGFGAALRGGRPPLDPPSPSRPNR